MMTVQPRNFICPETGEHCERGDCTRSHCTQPCSLMTPAQAQLPAPPRTARLPAPPRTIKVRPINADTFVSFIDPEDGYVHAVFKAVKRKTGFDMYDRFRDAPEFAGIKQAVKDRLDKIDIGESADDLIEILEGQGFEMRQSMNETRYVEAFARRVIEPHFTIALNNGHEWAWDIYYKDSPKYWARKAEKQATAAPPVIHLPPPVTPTPAPEPASPRPVYRPAPVRRQGSLSLGWVIAAVVVIIVLISAVVNGQRKVGAHCTDGWASYSVGRGTCSHHGGVAHWG